MCLNRLAHFEKADVARFDNPYVSSNWQALVLSFPWREYTAMLDPLARAMTDELAETIGDNDQMPYCLRGDGETGYDGNNKWFTFWLKYAQLNPEMLISCLGDLADAYEKRGVLCGTVCHMDESEDS